MNRKNYLVTRQAIDDVKLSDWKMDNLFWTGYCNAQRLEAINQIQHIVSEYGDIIDFNFFSDISITLIIEVKELNVDNLYVELCKLISLDKFDFLNSKSQKDRNIYLNISFAQATGDLRKEVPSIPG